MSFLVESVLEVPLSDLTLFVSQQNGISADKNLIPLCTQDFLNPEHKHSCNIYFPCTLFVFLVNPARLNYKSLLKTLIT